MSKRKEGKFDKDFDKKSKRRFGKKNGGEKFRKSADELKSGNRFKKDYDKQERDVEENSDDKKHGRNYEKRNSRTTNNRRGAGRFERKNTDRKRYNANNNKRNQRFNEDEETPNNRFENRKFVKKNEKTPENPANKDTVRLNKYVASAGIASRRKADELIKQGWVKVNGEVVREMGFRVKKTDEIQFKDKVIKPEQRKVYFLLNKPKNVITTTNDEKGRRHVMDIMGEVCEERIYPVGRLDRDTTGLLLFTNDGDLAKKLSHPSYEIKKIYHVILDKPIAPEELAQIRAGLTLEDGETPVDKVEYDESDSSKKSVVITVHIGRNRIVRRIFAHLGYTVLKLDRIYYGGLTKKNLGRGFHRPLKKQEVIMLKHFV